MERNRSQFGNCKEESAEWIYLNIAVCSNNPAERTHARAHTESVNKRKVPWC